MRKNDGKISERMRLFRGGGDELGMFFWEVGHGWTLTEGRRSGEFMQAEGICQRHEQRWESRSI